MINCEVLFNELLKNRVSFFTGVPDSLLKDFCSYITDNTESKNHIIAANEGAAVAIGTGFHLSTGEIPLVYLQNSGLGNTINPILSLADREVYGIPMILLIGWRGEPNVKDEPQHVKQGRIQNDLLEAMEIPYIIIDSNTEDIEDVISGIVRKATTENSPVALVVRKGTFGPYKLKESVSNELKMTRERAISNILDYAPTDAIFVSTTGMPSRELFEQRVNRSEGHHRDFLTVGAMGHCSQIALGISLKTEKKVICCDGDGAVLMHMGSLPIIGQNGGSNYIHVILNNAAHDSVGGQPTVGFEIDLPKIAIASGYKNAYTVTDEIGMAEKLDEILKSEGPSLLEVRVRKGARKDLGRPTKTPKENKLALMEFLNNIKVNE